MKKVAIVTLAVVAVLAAALSVIAARFEPTIDPGTIVGDVPVGSLTKEEAAKKLRVWWEGEKLKPLTLRNKLFSKDLPSMTAGQLGIGLDDAASVANLPMTDLVQAVTDRVSSGPQEPKRFPIQFKSVGIGLDGLRKKVRSAVGKSRPPQVLWQKGAIIRKPEVTSYALDEKGMSDAVVRALESDGIVQVPLTEAPKTVPDEELAKITGVAAEYSTHFPSYQSSRNTNIRLAAAKLNGVVLMPGERLSFNQTVGQRTVRGGYKEAPVLKYGKHDTGIGGGICQVSTTLYNAALLADIKIVRRNNHSLPSAYVPVGRDATVDWGTLDFVIENNKDIPIAVSSTYQSGKITFRILGQKDPSIVVKIVTSGHKIIDRGQERVLDTSLKPGTTKVVEKGSSAHSINVYRVVYKDGVEIRREPLGRSYYAGCPRTVAYNPAPAAPKALTSTATTPPPGTITPPPAP